MNSHMMYDGYSSRMEDYTLSHNIQLNINMLYIDEYMSVYSVMMTHHQHMHVFVSYRDL